MLQHPPQHAAVAGADDQHVRRGAMRQQRHMGQHLLVDELVALGDLDHAVQHHDAAVRDALEDHDVLEVALHPRQFALHQEALAPVGIQRLVDPAIGRHRRSPNRTARIIVSGPPNTPRRSADQPAPLLGQQDRLRREHLLQHRQRMVRIARAAHEDVHRGEVALRPSVDRDVAFRQHQHAADAAIGAEVVEVAVQDRRVGCFGRITQRTVDQLRIGQVGGAPQIQQQMRAGELHAVLLDEIVLLIDPRSEHPRPSPVG